MVIFHSYVSLPMGKSTISMAIFNSYVCLPEGNTSDRTNVANSQCHFYAPSRKNTILVGINLPFPVIGGAVINGIVLATKNITKSFQHLSTRDVDSISLLEINNLEVSKVQGTLCTCNLGRTKGLEAAEARWLVHG